MNHVNLNGTYDLSTDKLKNPNFRKPHKVFYFLNKCLVFQVGMVNIALWKVVPRDAVVMDNAKPIMLWNGNVGVSLDGLVKAVTYHWNKIALIDVTMIKVGPKKK